MSKLATIDYQGKDYATVPVRLKEFRENNPRASIETEPTYNEDGSVTFKATIILDTKEEYSAKSTGNARYTAKELEGKKAFEKLETISVGRALALLGYLNNGQVATSEEMLEFENYQENKVELAIEAIESAENRAEFESILAGLNPEQQRKVAPVVQKRIKELKNGTPEN